jgi:hypothetical protein
MTRWSDEVHGIVAAIRATGIPHRVTDIGGPGHIRSSWHYRLGTRGAGLAVDLAGPTPSRDSPQLAAVYQALERHGPRCAELIYSGPGGGYWKNGRRVSPYSTAGHHNHIHIAVPVGTVLRVPTPEQEIIVVPDNPDLPNIEGPLSFHPIFTADGVATGYYIFGTTTGEVHSHGPGAVFFNRSEDITPDDE